METTVDIAQLSEAIGAVHVAVFEQAGLYAPVLTVMFGEHPVKVGGVLSSTVTLKLQVVAFACMSVAV